MDHYGFRLYDFQDKEKAEFLKDRYGTGGGSHALCGADKSHSSHDAKGLDLSRGGFGEQSEQEEIPEIALCHVPTLLERTCKSVFRVFQDVTSYKEKSHAQEYAWDDAETCADKDDDSYSNISKDIVDVCHYWHLESSDVELGDASFCHFHYDSHYTCS